MPPKPNPKVRRSQPPTPNHIAIYQILADKDEENSVRQLAKKIEALIKHDPEAVERSFCIFVLMVCGLDGCVGKINWREPTTSLTQLLQQMCQQDNKKPIYTSQLYLINPKSKFHKEFLTRTQQFLSLAISEQLSLTTQTDMLKQMCDFLLVISRCKMRNIRHCSVVMAGLVVGRMVEYYGELGREKLGKRAARVFGIVELRYVEELIKPRLKDIDQQIRQKAFQILNETLSSLPDLLTPAHLHKLYTPILTQNKQKITQLCLKSILKLFQLDKEKLTPTTIRNLSAFGSDLIKAMEELVLLPNRNSCLAMDVLVGVQEFDGGLACLKPKLIAKVFQIHGYQKFQQGLKKAVHIFLKSLLPSPTLPSLIPHRSVLLPEITHLLCSINSTRLLTTILHEFFNTHPQLFVFDDMFLLLLTEYYHRDGADVELGGRELYVLCFMIGEFNGWMRARGREKDREKDREKEKEREKEEMAYNRNVLSNSKQLFYQKIPKHPTICPLYLRLFSLLFTPIPPPLSNYLPFIQQKTFNFIKDQQFLTLSGQNLILAQQIVQECAAIAHMLAKEAGRDGGDWVLGGFGVGGLDGKDGVDQVDVIKVAGLVAKFDVEGVLGEGMFRKVLAAYPRFQDKIAKLEALSYCYHSLRHSLTTLFNTPSQAHHENHLSLRSLFLSFTLQSILASSSEDTVVKVAAFNIVCRALRLISNSKIADLPAVYFEPGQGSMELLYGFVGEFVSFEEEEVSEATMMMANTSISLESQEIREQILHNLYAVFSDCFRLTLNKHSIRFLTNFLLTSSPLLKPAQKYLDSLFLDLTRAELAPENSNKFIFWRIYSEICAEIQPDEEEKLERVNSRLLDLYYRYRKNQGQVKGQLSNKLMLYAADTIDKSLNNGNYRTLLTVRALLKKTYRRFPKETLQRLYIFFCSKIANLEDKAVNEMKKFLNKIGKVKKPKDKDSKKDKDDSESSESEKEDSQKGDEEQNEKESEDEREDIMVERTPMDDNRRSTRSRTKRKPKN